MKKVHPTIFIMVAFFLSTTLNAQSLTSTDSIYSVGNDFYLQANNFYAKDSILVINSDFSLDTTKIKVTNLNHSKLILLGQIQKPGLLSIFANCIPTVGSKMGIFPVMDTSFYYIPSSEKTSEEFPILTISKIVSQCNGSNQNTCNAIKDSLLNVRDSLKYVFSKLKTKTSITNPSTPENAPVTTDSFYHYLTKVAQNIGASLDSGRMISAVFTVNFTKGLTLINWLVDSSVNADRNNLQQCYVYRKQILDSLIYFCVIDSLMQNSVIINSQLNNWLTTDRDGSELKDQFLFIKRPDNYMADYFLTLYKKNVDKTTSDIWIGFTDTFFEQLIFAFRIVGSNPKKS